MVSARGVHLLRAVAHRFLADCADRDGSYQNMHVLAVVRVDSFWGEQEMFALRSPNRQLTYWAMRPMVSVLGGRRSTLPVALGGTAAK